MYPVSFSLALHQAQIWTNRFFKHAHKGMLLIKLLYLLGDILAVCKNSICDFCKTNKVFLNYKGNVSLSDVLAFPKVCNN